MGNTLEVLGIYWPKLIAQMINFAIVLFVLWKWAYRPILALLAERREKIAEGVANADKIKAELARTEAARREILDKANIQANKEIEEARVAAAKIREKATQDAITEAAEISAKRKLAADMEIARDRENLRKEIAQLVVKTTSAVTGKILSLDDQKRLNEETSKQLAA